MRQLPKLDDVIVSRFKENVWRTYDPNACWLWMGSPCSKKPRFYINKISYTCTRIAWKIHSGFDPGDMLVCHTCDVPRCMNPSHLWLGTLSDDMIDMVQKGRHARQILTCEDVRVIRNLLGLGTSAYALAKMFGVSQTTIYKIRDNQLWRHVD